MFAIQLIGWRVICDEESASLVVGTDNGVVRQPALQRSKEHAARQQTKKVVEISNESTSVMADVILLLKLKCTMCVCESTQNARCYLLDGYSVAWRSICA